MSATVAYAQTLGTWLKKNLGPRCLAPLTGSDMPALKASVHIAELWCRSDFNGRARAAEAFRHVVSAMQPGCRYLAFHAIAHAGDWGHRAELWTQARLEAPGEIPKCAHE